MKFTLEQLNIGTLYTHYNPEIAVTLPYTRLIFVYEEGELNFYIGSNTDILFIRKDDATSYQSIRSLADFLNDDDIIRVMTDACVSSNGSIVLYGIVYTPDEIELSSNIPQTFTLFDAALIPDTFVDEVNAAENPDEVWNDDTRRLQWYNEEAKKLLAKFIKSEWHEDTAKLVEQTEGASAE